MEAGKLTGIVKRKIENRGFAFLEKVEGQEDDVFVHISSFLNKNDYDDMQVGDTCEIGELEQVEGKGVQAIDVRLIKGAEKYE